MISSINSLKSNLEFNELVNYLSRQIFIYSLLSVISRGIIKSVLLFSKHKIVLGYICSL